MARGQNIISKVFNKPQLITLEGLQPIVDYLSSPERSSQLKLAKGEEPKQLLRSDFSNEESYRRRVLERKGINPDTMVGTLEIKDTLVNREGQLNADCMELTSYEGLKKTFKAQVDEGISHCVLMFDSGGGEAYGCFEASAYVKKLAKENGVKLTAYVDGMSASASFAWTCIADEIIANPMSQVGSVGVVVQLYNNNQMLKNIGIERSFVYAGGNKIPFDADGDFTEKFINDLQESVNKSYDKFVSHVATNLNISEDTVRNTQASVFDADVALEIGFIHKIMEVEDFENYINMETSDNTNTIYFNNDVDDKSSLKHNKETPKMSEQNKDNLESTVATLQTQLTGLQATNTTLTTQLATLQTDLAKEALAKETAEKALADYKSTAQQEARVTKLASVFGTESDKPQMYATMFASLDDTAFDKVVADFQASVTTKSKEMEELGHNAPTDPVTETEEEKLLAQAKARKANKQ